MTKEKIQEFTFKITRANETLLVVLLYEILLCYLEEAQELSEKGVSVPGEDRNFTEEEFRLAEIFRKCRGCFNELLQSLHMEYEPAGSLHQLYVYSLKRLAHSERCGEPTGIREVHKIIKALHDAYEQIADRNKNEPVMNNSQTVYAGLTYGPGALTENMADQGSNRGMRV